jgi:hypothetical protein
VIFKAGGNPSTTLVFFASTKRKLLRSVSISLVLLAQARVGIKRSRIRKCLLIILVRSAVIGCADEYEI